jgi:hypothetical protein
MTSSSSRSFAQCSSNELARLESREYSQKTVYSMAFVEKIFMQFLNSKNITNIPTEKKQLDCVLKEMWPSLRTLKNQPYRATSLTSMRNMLRTVIQQKISVDIFNDPDLLQQNVVFENYLRVLKKQGYGCISHHKEVSKENLKTICEKLDPQNPQQLLWLTWLNVQLHLCRRGIENSSNMKKTDLVLEQYGQVNFIRLKKNEKTKNHTEIDEDADSGGRISSITGHLKCPVKIITTYLSKLNPNCDSLWQKPKQKVSPHSDCWFDAVPLGNNQLSSMMKKISSFCGLSEIYTNHCLRVSACTLLGESGYSDLDIQAVSKHKSVDALGIYKRIKTDKKLEMSQSISQAMDVDCSLTYAESDKPLSSADESLKLGKLVGGARNSLCSTLNNDMVDEDWQDVLALFDEYEKVQSISHQEVVNASTTAQVNTQQEIVKKGHNIVVLKHCSNMTLNFH